MSSEQPDHLALAERFKLTPKQVDDTCAALHAVSEDMLAHIPPSAILFLTPEKQVIAREAKRKKNIQE